MKFCGVRVEGRHGGMKITRSTPPGSSSSTPGIFRPDSASRSSLDAAEFDQVGRRVDGTASLPRSRKDRVHHLARLPRSKDRGLLRRTHGEAACEALRRTRSQSWPSTSGRAIPPAREAPCPSGESSRSSPTSRPGANGEKRVVSLTVSSFPREWPLAPASTPPPPPACASSRTSPPSLPSRLHRPRPRNRRRHPRHRRKGARRQSRRGHRLRSCRCANR